MNEQRRWGGLAAPLGGALVLAVLAIPVWLAYRGTGPESAPQPARPAADRLRQRGASAPQAAQLPQIPPAARAVPPAAASAAAASESCRPSPGTERPPALPPGLQAAETLRARERVAAALVGGPDELTRAVGRVVQGLGHPRPAPTAAVICEGSRCPPPAESAELAMARKLRSQAAAAPRDALARQALGSQSPEVYGMAWQACRQAEDEPGSSCRMLSADQWTRLEPDNAVAWLEAAAQAQQRGDAAALDEAMFRVSRAGVVDSRAGQLADTLVKRLPAGTPPPLALQLVGELGELDAAWNRQRYQLPLSYCSGARLADANLHQRCDEIAGALLSRGRALQELNVVMQLGERLGWAPERVEAVAVQRDALAQALAHESPQVAATGDGDGTVACNALRRKSERLAELVRLGERGAARLAMQRAGKSEAELARQYREQRQRRVPAGASAPAPLASRP